ncbi:MAG: S53 family peptidase [Alicyclobacillus herbarius]|uniref:S53 family peptidase n=1 Tax=Alicyclobacillus herbarius TaxID=122960 RepID=UPI0023528593|nr:S53 family peptidase [Alicyclobacillus herbarius]MCL6632587.1 S53 family peptidase [Alicyclobacillus herbarius]
MEIRRVVYATGTVVPNNGQGYYPADIKRLYNFPDNLTGQGQTIGILEFSNGYNLRDAQQFWQMHGITAPQVTFVSVDGTPNDGGTSPDDEEATLDLQWAGALAPGARIVVYEANAGSTYEDFAQAMTRTLEYILNDTQYQPSVLSISYGDGEVSFNADDLRQWADLVAQLDAKGITVCIASGDQGAYGLHDTSGPKTRHADAPASVPAAIAVGGTSLQPDGQETAWTYNSPDNGGATGGGFSSVFTKPDYQSGISGNGRGLPDIACNADPATGYQIIFQGQAAVVGGTSVSCPVFAALVALANQAREQQGLPPLSGLAKVLYSGAAGLGYRDITVGNNTFNGVTGYKAGPGWDACTGFGSFDASQLISYLSTLPAATQPSPTPTPDPQPTPAPQPQPSPAPEPQPEPNPAPTPSPEPQPVRGHRHYPSPRRTWEFIVRVKAVIQRVEADVHHDGASHHHLLIDNIRVLKVWNGTQWEVADKAFVAIRYGDELGLPGPIPNLAAGQTIELQGRYIPQNDVYPSVGNPGEAVIDETHHPFGFVVYEGQMYR